MVATRLILLSGCLAAALPPDICKAGNIPLTGHRGYNLGTIDPGLLSGDYLSTGSSIARLHVRFDLTDRQGVPKLTTVEEWLPHLKAAVQTLNQQGQVAVVSLHNPTRQHDAKRQDWIDGGKFRSDWKKLSNGLQGVGSASGVWYDLWNEPPNTRQRQSLLQNTAADIRNLGDGRAIVVPSVGDRSTSVSDFRPLDGIDNQILGVHLWDMHNLTHGFAKEWQILSKKQRDRLRDQARDDAERASKESGEWQTLTKKQRRAVRDTGEAEAVKASKAKTVPDPTTEYRGRQPESSRQKGKQRIENALAKVARVADRHDLPVFIGELGMYADHPDAGKYFRDVLGILDEQHPSFNVALHAWKEAFVWDYEGQAYDGVLEGYITSAPNAGLVGSPLPLPPMETLTPVNSPIGGGSPGDDLGANHRGPETPEPTAAALILLAASASAARGRRHIRQAS